MSTTSKATRDSWSVESHNDTPAGLPPTIESTASKSTPVTSVSTTATTATKLNKPARTSSPTQKTMYRLRVLGYHPAIVERWNPHARIRQDLLGFIDVLALGQGETIAIQTCSRGDVAARRTKILEHPNFPAAVRPAGLCRSGGGKTIAFA